MQQQARPLGDNMRRVLKEQDQWVKLKYPAQHGRVHMTEQSCTPHHDQEAKRERARGQGPTIPFQGPTVLLAVWSLLGQTSTLFLLS